MKKYLIKILYMAELYSFQNVDEHSNIDPA